MSLVFLDCNVACLALVPVRDEHREQVGWAGGVESVGDREVPVSLYLSHSCQGSSPAARFASG